MLANSRYENIVIQTRRLTVRLPNTSDSATICQKVEVLGERKTYLIKTPYTETGVPATLFLTLCVGLLCVGLLWWINHSRVVSLSVTVRAKLV